MRETIEVVTEAIQAAKAKDMEDKENGNYVLIDTMNVFYCTTIDSSDQLVEAKE